ncbi:MULTISPECIES: hypothetical protein [Paenibacillus]|uniref:Uncharacterized protein n=1 Tax=Paenibacillus albilobatus TaxID=2716884 RepID=A0A919XIY5_9BACL|nr:MULTISPECIES: hypothetical protein [Paenibacillus]GIO31340.1 hypothetical protein J2TS6_24810 [Paenibacillus albilobatus]
MASEVTQLEKNRTTFIKRSLIGFAIWQLTYLIRYLHLDTVKLITVFTAIISVMGGIVWAYYLIKIVLLSFRMQKKRRFAISLNNEYFQMIRLKSFTVGFWVILGLVGIFFTLSLFVALNIQLVLHLMLVVGVISPLIYYLILDKDEVLDDE